MANISVIIPVYNHLSALKKSLASLSRQTMPPQEVIVVDDGSTDGEVGAIVRASNLSCPVKLIKQSNQGAAAARNRGFKESGGEYVIFWDADTVARPEMLERLERQLDQHSEASYAYCSFYFGWKKMLGQKFNGDNLKKINFIDTTSLIRRNSLRDISGPFDYTLRRFQDWDLWLTLLKKDRVGIFVPKILFKKIVGARRGYSRWIPKIFFRLFSANSAIRAYQAARQIVIAKHGLPW